MFHDNKIWCIKTKMYPMYQIYYFLKHICLLFCAHVYVYAPARAHMWRSAGNSVPSILSYTEVKLLDLDSDCLPPLPSSCQPPQKHNFRLGDGSGSLTTLVTLSEDPYLVPSTHIGQLITTCNSRCRVSDALFWPPQKPTHMWHMLSEPNTYACMPIKIDLKILFQYAVHMRTKMFPH